MKKNLLTIAMLASCTSLFAQTTKFEGWAAGLGVSAGSLVNKITDTDGYDVDTGKVNTAGFLDFSYASVVGSSTLLAVGATYDLNKSKAASLTTSDYGASLISKNHYSLYVQPMYLISNDTAVFGKLAYHSFSGVIPRNEWYYDAEKSGKFNGIGYGFGVKTFLNKDLYLQVEAGWVDYKKKSFYYDIGSIGYDYKVKSTNGAVSIGYQF